MDELPGRDLRRNPPPRGIPGQHNALTRKQVDPQRKAIEAAVAQLRGRAFLYDDPDAYAAGVRDALLELDVQFDARSGSRAPWAEK